MLKDFATEKCETCFYVDLDHELEQEYDIYERTSIYFNKAGYETFGKKLGLKL